MERHVGQGSGHALIGLEAQGQAARHECHGVAEFLAGHRLGPEAFHLEHHGVDRLVDPFGPDAGGGIPGARA
ncbi:MAG: hypothetical protein ACE5EL_01525, partial [Anaerolineae bacterium]